MDRLVVLLGRAHELEVERVAERHLVSERAPQIGGKARLELDDVEAVGGAGVGEQDPRTAGVGQHRHATTRGQRLGRQQQGGVEELADGVGAHDAGLREQRLDVDVRRADRPRWRARRWPAPRRSCDLP